MKHPTKVSVQDRHIAIIAILARKLTVSGANDKQASIATLIALQTYDAGETSHRAIKAGIGIAERFIEHNIANPTRKDCGTTVWATPWRRGIRNG